MSRHRDVRCMKYSDEYDGYDDVYGHSVEDDYCTSPSAEQFLFDRSREQNIASFITEPDIVEDSEDDSSVSLPANKKSDLSELERTQLLSCMEAVKNIIGDSISESKLEEEIIRSEFNTEVALDRLLKESFQKATAEQETNRQRSSKEADPCPGFTSSFAIPKFSLSHGLKVSDSMNIPISGQSHVNSESSFSSLAEMIASHKNTVKPKQCESNLSSFGSLADLTAHHLQKSNTPTNNIEFNTKFSPNSGFIIPKLNLNKSKESFVQTTEFGVQNNIIKNQFNVDENQIDSIRKGIINFKLGFDPNNEIEKEKLSNSENVKYNIEHVRTPSPDNCLIDLSAALKEIHVLDSKSDKQKKSVTDLYQDTVPYVDMVNDSFDDSDSKTDIECTLNLNSLRHIRLPYMKRTVSSLGKVLGRKWKLKKPFISCKTQQYKTVKRFDFSTPYTRT